jgi:Tripartite tricarboxylate transporter TctB family
VKALRRFLWTDAFTVFIIGLFVFALTSSAGWPRAARLFPQVVGVPGLTLAVIYLVRGLLGHERIASAQGADISTVFTNDASTVWRRTLGFGASLLSLMALIWLLGFFIAIPLYISAYLKLSARLKWTHILMLTLGTWIVFFGVFDTYLGIKWLTPLIRGPQDIIQTALRSITLSFRPSF